MNYYSPDSEPPSERVMLIDIGHEQYQSEYGKLVATVQRRAMPDGVNPDTGYRTYYDGAGSDASIGLRNCTWSSGKKSALFVYDLQVTNQFDKSKPSERSYGERVIFKPFSVEERDAEEMHKTFTKLNRGLGKMAEEFGGISDYADLVIRVAKVLGIRKFAVYNRNVTNRTLVQPFREFGASEVRHYVDHLTAKARGLE